MVGRLVKPCSVVTVTVVVSPPPTVVLFVSVAVVVASASAGIAAAPAGRPAAGIAAARITAGIAAAARPGLGHVRHFRAGDIPIAFTRAWAFTAGSVAPVAAIGSAAP